MTAGIHKPKTPSVKFGNEVFAPSNPIEIPVTEFTHERRIRVVLRCHKKASHKFYINFKNGDDIVMQTDPRVPHKTFIFNSFYDGHWQIAETLPMIANGCSIEPEKNYTIDFVPTRFHSILVYIDGRFTYEFRERRPDFKVRSVEIGGDVHIHSVHLT